MIKQTLFFIFALLLLPLAFASSGCFLYSESYLYCQDISDQQAQEECSSGQCIFDNIFRQESCPSTPDCQKIVCKTTCREELAGRCPAGVAAPGDCQPGCCQYDYGEETSCGIVQSRQRCLLAAENHDALQYIFHPDLSEEECSSRCGAGFLGGEVTPLHPKEGDPAPDQFPESPQEPLPWKLIFIITGTVIGIIAITFFTRKFVKQLEEKPSSPASPFWRLLSPFRSDPARQQRIDQMQQQHQKKVKHHQREQFLAEQGLTPELASEEQRKLHRLAKKGHTPVPQDTDPFEKLKRLTEK